MLVNNGTIENMLVNNGTIENMLVNNATIEEATEIFNTLPHHSCRVPTHQHRLVGLKVMVVVQSICVLKAWQGALVDCHLAIVLAQGLQQPR